MTRETVKVDKQLYENLIKENIKLRNEIAQLKGQLTPQIMENQISIEEYIRTLKKGKKKNGQNI